MTMDMDKIIRYNVERIGTIIFDIQRYLQDLDDLNICPIKDLEKWKLDRN
jgi:hypothetical protein